MLNWVQVTVEVGITIARICLFQSSGDVWVKLPHCDLNRALCLGTLPTEKDWRLQGLELGCMDLNLKFYYLSLHHYEFQVPTLYLLVYPWTSYVNLLNLRFNSMMVIYTTFCFLGL